MSHRVVLRTTMSRDIKRFTVIMEAFRPDSKMGHDEVRRVVEDAVRRGHGDELPLVACELGNLEALKMTLEAGCHLTSECTVAAMRVQNFAMIFFLQERENGGLDSASCAEAAFHGRMHILQNFFRGRVDAQAALRAAEGGQLLALRYAHENGVELNGEMAMRASERARKLFKIHPGVRRRVDERRGQAMRITRRERWSHRRPGGFTEPPTVYVDGEILRRGVAERRRLLLTMAHRARVRLHRAHARRRARGAQGWSSRVRRVSRARETRRRRIIERCARPALQRGRRGSIKNVDVRLLRAHRRRRLGEISVADVRVRRREDHARRIAITFTRERRHTGNALEPPLLDDEDEDDAAYPIARRHPPHAGCTICHDALATARNPCAPYGK